MTDLTTMHSSTSVDIDGNKIRLLREQKELTQLYLATVVGVTTDTISRWENRRYPAIKLENAKKLAEALGVPLEELLERKAEDSVPDDPGGQDETTQVEPSAAPAAPRVEGQRLFPVGRVFWISLVGLALVAIAVGLYFGWNAPTVTAVRLAPSHTAPNVPFPVIVVVNGEEQAANTLLIREELKGDGEAFGPSAGSETKQFGKNPRWIGKLVQGKAVFGYMVHPGKKLATDEDLRFSGDTIAREGQLIGDEIGGAKRVTIAPYHWVDVDRDYVISDSEILKAYETYSIPGEALVDFTGIEELWLAGRYKWNKKSLTFVPAEPEGGGKDKAGGQ